MANAPIELLPAHHVRELARRAFDEIDALSGTDSWLTTSSEHLRWSAAHEALRFSAVAAGGLADPSLVPLLDQIIERLDRIDRWVGKEAHLEVVASAIGRLLPSCQELPDEAADLVAHTEPDVRSAVARGLPLKLAGARALMNQLADDTEASVRTIARTRLEQAGAEVAWWRGKLASDPAAVMTEEQQREHGPALAEIARLLDLEGYEAKQHREELTALACPLPTPVLLLLCRCIYRTLDEYQHGWTTPKLSARMLEAEEGPALLFDLIEGWAQDNYAMQAHHQLAAMLSLLPAPRRQDIASATLAHLLALLQRGYLTDDLSRHDPRNHNAEMLAIAAALAWVSQADPTPLLDALLAISAIKMPFWVAVPGPLDDVLARSDLASGPILGRVIEARLAGYPQPWTPLERYLDSLLANAQAASVRPSAEQALLSLQPKVRAWGMENLLGPLRDPALDGSLAQVAARWLSDPMLRQALMTAASDEVRWTLLPQLRSALRRGDLSFVEAANTMEAIDDLYGGQVHSETPLRERKRRAGSTDTRLSDRAARLAKVPAEALGDEALRGPATDEEWRILREKRAPWLAQLPAVLPEEGRFRDLPEGVVTSLHVLPPGPWQPEDLDLLRALVTRHEARCNRMLVLQLVSLISSKPPPPPDGQTLLARVEAATPKDLAALSLLADALQDARIAVGLVPEGNDPDEDEDEDEGDDDWSDEGDEGDEGEDGDEGEGWEDG